MKAISTYIKGKKFVYVVCEVDKRKENKNKTKTKTKTKQNLSIDILCAREL